MRQDIDSYFGKFSQVLATVASNAWMYQPFPFATVWLRRASNDFPSCLSFGKANDDRVSDHKCCV
jgi:hypothetical protein